VERWLQEVKKIDNDFSEGRRFSTVSDLDIEPMYTYENIKDLDFKTAIGYPGAYPLTRGCHATGYRGRVRRYQPLFPANLQQLMGESPNIGNTIGIWNQAGNEFFCLMVTLHSDCNLR